ncbi:hypothetical protein RRG08_011146 [Elysia crispata]|uniref:Uncharacterized protein n=1 Tax=Elysia crispata TaxID=231223 RepID=A0AAE1A1B6_9GAST|nr:hypothetical protein RRG08_011146 [Elysia crispata]
MIGNSILSAGHFIAIFKMVQKCACACANCFRCLEKSRSTQAAWVTGRSVDLDGFNGCDGAGRPAPFSRRRSNPTRQRRYRTAQEEILRESPLVNNS